MKERKEAIIYTRVSTDEQGEKGFSLRDQEAKLRRYCELHNIEVAAHFQDDYSAKFIDRPQFTKLRTYARQNRQTIQYILVLKWDRFSRITSDSYFLIKEFDLLGIEVQAIEQPINWNVPESKVMLGVYLAIPQVENERRSLNTIAGMRRALLEGRWLGPATHGYKSARDAKDKPIKVFSDEAPLVKEAFIEYSKGIYSQEEVRIMMQKKGLKISKTRFNELLRNPKYVGKIVIPEYKDEPLQLVKGLHEPLVSEDVFYMVQDIINGRNPNKPKRNILRRAELPLRGFLKCKSCGNVMTGSASKGRNSRYFYYHCQGHTGCTERIKADQANKTFEQLLNWLKPEQEIEDLHIAIMEDLFKANISESKSRITKLHGEIERVNKRLKHIRTLLADEKIDIADYNEMKKECSEELYRMEREKADEEAADDYSLYLRSGINFMKNLGKSYADADLEIKQYIIGSIFPEKLVFDKNQYRTAKINEAVEIICRNSKGLKKLKRGKSNDLPRLVPQAEKVSNQIKEGLKCLHKLQSAT